MRKNGKMRKILILLLCFVFFIGLSGSVSAAIPSGDACEVVVDSDGDEIPDDAKKAEILKHAYRIQVPFIENRGQVESKDVRFYANTFGGTIFVEKDGVLTYNLPVEDKGGVVIKEIFTEKQITITGLEPSPTRVNYFIGKDKSNWKTNIPSYDSIPLGEIYKGIDLTLRAYGNNVEKLFTVLPEENPEIIRIKIEGAKGLKVNEKGELEVITELGTVRFTKPLAYQKIGGKKETVEVTYVSYKENTYGFKVGNYDKKRPLIIDPLLASTFIGGGVGDNDYGRSIAIDATGNVYVTGETHSSDYPTTSGAYDESHNGYCDVFVSRLDSTLSTLLASTFIGGGSADCAYSIALDESGNVYVTGETHSSDYATTSGAYDESCNGDRDVFVSKLDSTLSTLLASTSIGGGVGDYAYGRSIAIDATGNVYVTGRTDSSGYPTTSGAYDESYNGGRDTFVSRLDSTLSTLLASTFIGGGSADYVYSIAIDESGNVYVTGYTDSSDYPTTPGAYDESHNGYYDVFVSKLDMSLSSLLSSTFIGGGDRDEGYSIALDGSGNVYVTGDTHSSDYPTTSGAYDESFNGAYDVFVSKLDSSLSTLLSSTFIGGGEDDVGYSIAIDGSGNVYVTGLTSSSDYSTTSGAYDRSFNGYLYDVFISKLDSSLSSLLASTFIGGGSADYAYSIALDETGNVYVTGLTYSSDYPITSGAYDESHNGYYDVFVSKLDRDLSRPEYVQDSDGDGVPDDQDGCPNDPNKIEPGICGCGVADTDSDGDGTADCNDGCPNDPNKIELGVCGCGVADTDSDGDGTADCNDNCPSDPNSDQGNVDSDEYGDVCDICPDDFTNTCNPDRSAGVSIGADGGTISTPDGSVTIIVPSGAVGDDTSLSITETGTSYELTTNLGKGIALFGVSIQPEGLVFNTPVTIIFAWLDEYDDGKVDGTNIQERKLIITKDNVAITGRCGQDFGCDMAENKFTFAVLGLSEFALVFVDDEGPITSNVLADPNPVSVNTEITLTATVDDSQTGESTIGSAEYNIDGGDYIQMDAQDGNFDSVSEDVEIIIPAFAEPGVYSICVRGWDIFENIEGAEDCILLAVYDPTGGFVTGGGWINSPEGAYTPDPSLTGKANFGFVSKYKKGATVPTGHTEFQFKVADLNFHSDAYDWLVIAGAKARYKGTGTINGEGNYGFMLSAIDEELTPSTDDDLFRIKIWDTENNDAVVYDNQMGDAGDAELTTEVQGGSIKIHKDK